MTPPILSPPLPQPGRDGGHLLFQLLLGTVHVGPPLRRALPPPGGPGARARTAHDRHRRWRREEGQEEEERKEGEEREKKEGAAQDSWSE